MVNKCCVPHCRGNYDVENKVTVFKFPDDEKLRSNWITKISRDNFQITKNSRVCERHFSSACIERYAEAFDEKEGRIISVPLQRIRLKKDAVPTIFQKYPSYMSETPGGSREDPETKRTKLEDKFVQKAIAESVKTNFNYNRERSFSNILDLKNCLEKFKPSKLWSIIAKEDNVIFVKISVVSEKVELQCAVLIDSLLSVAVTYRGAVIGELNSYIFPKKVNKCSELFKILDRIETFDLSPNKQQSTSLAINSLLDDLKDNLHEDKEKQIDFIKEQICLTLSKPEKYRYSPETLIFACMFYITSPAAYKFVRNSGEFILPHKSTIHKVCSKYDVDPQDETYSNNFLGYARQRAKSLQKQELYVSLMMDEIHLKECFDFKGGNIVGFAHDSTNSATSAHVFMLQGLFSKFREVIHILPVKTISAKILFEIVKKIIITLEEFGFKVVVVVSDNNSINRKCISYFQNPIADYVYPHPCDPQRPLFYCVDTVHLIKSVRNNWVNQKNGEQAMYFPSFDPKENDVSTASLLTVKKMYELESGNLVKHAYTLTQKALWPSSLEKQNVKIALQLMNITISKSLLTLGDIHDLSNYSGTAEYIKIFHSWFSIMNVKSPSKGIHLLDPFSYPLTFSDCDERLIFLNNFIDWLKKWGEMNSDTGRLSKETHSALLISTTCMIELTRYCVEDLGMTYLLPGKVQTDELEYRFSLYRRMAGTQYHISIRQILEVEKKLRTCNVLRLSMSSNLHEAFPVTDFDCAGSDDIENENSLEDLISSVTVNDNDLSQIENDVPVLTFLAGYCTHSVLSNKLKCENCKSNLTIDRSLSFDTSFKIISDFDRGGLKYPTVDVVNIVVHNFVVIKKLLSDHENSFLKHAHHRQIAINATLETLALKEFSIGVCENHRSKNVMTLILRASSNILLKNYCKSKNDRMGRKQNKRKMSTLSGT